MKTAPAARLVGLLAALAGGNACQLVGDFDQFTPPERVEGGLPPPTCPGAAPSDVDVSNMRLLNNGSRCFWMDRTEVSRGEYAEFLDGPRLQVGTPACLRNEYEPAPIAGDSDEVCHVPPGVTLSTGDEHPIVCVDWCDALGYCASRGKTLCNDSYISPATRWGSDWYAACANDARETEYPFGERYVQDRCNDGENATSGCNATGACTTIPVGSLPGCVNDAQVFDLSGNVREWTASCDGANSCLVRGGSMQTPAAGVGCSTFESAERLTRYATTGFRCCYYPLD